MGGLVDVEGQLAVVGVGAPVAHVQAEFGVDRVADADARDLFTTLLGVSGVGPKIALATLAVYDAAALRHPE